MNIGDLVATLRVKDRDFNSKVDQAGRRFGRLGDILRRGAAAVGRAFAAMGRGVATVGRGIINFGRRAIPGAITGLGRFRDGFMSTAAAASAFSGRMGTLGGVARRVLNPGINAVGRFRDGFMNADAAASAFSGRMGTLGGVARRVLDPGINAIGRFRDGFRSADAAASAFSGRMGTLGGVAQRVIGPGITGLGRFRDGFMSTSAAASAFSGRMGTLGGVTRSVFNGAATGARGVGTALAATGRAVVPVAHGLGRFADGFRSADAAASAFSGRMGTLGGVARSAFNGVATGARGVGTALSAVGHAGMTVGRTIGSGMAMAGNAAANMGSRLMTSINNSRASVDGLMGSVRGLVGQLGLLGGVAAVAKVTSDVFGLSNALIQAESSLISTTGSAEKAGDMLDRISTIAKGSSTDHKAFLDMGTGLAYLGIEGEQAERVMRNVDLAATAAGTGTQAFESTTNALTKALNRGKASNQELQMISNQGIPIMEALADAFGVTTGEIETMASEGKISVNDLAGALETAGGGTFDSYREGAELMGRSVPEQFDRIRTSVVSALSEAAVPIMLRAGEVMSGFGDRLDDGLGRIPDILNQAKAAMDEWGITDALRNIGEHLGTLARIVLPGVQGAIVGFAGAIGGAVLAVSWLLDLISPLTNYLAENEGVARTLGITLGGLAGGLIALQGAALLGRGALMLFSPAITVFQGVMRIARNETVRTVAVKLAQWAWLAITATAHALRVGAAWLLTAGWRAAKAVAQTVAAVAVKLAQWAWLAITATAHAIKVGAAWLLTAGWRAAQAVAQTTAAVIAKLAQWALLAAQATMHAARVAGAWLLTAGTNAAIAVAQTVAAVVAKLVQWALLGAQAMVHAARVAAAWLLTAGVNATIAVAQTTAAVVAKLAQWALLATQAMVNAARVGAAWLLTAGANAAVAVAQTTMIVAQFLAQWALLAVQSMVNAARVAAAWLLTTGAAAATAAAQMAMIAARFVAQWVLMSAQAMARAAIMAAAWIVAMGPIGWVIAAVVGLVVLIIANWDRVKAFTQAAWSAVTTFISNAWSNIVSTVTSWAQRAVAFVQNAWSRAQSITSSAWSSLVSTIASWIARAITWVAGIPGRVVSALGNIGSLLLSSGRALVEGFLSGIRNTWDRVVNFVKDGVQRIRNLLPFSPAKEGPLSGSGYVTHSGEALTSDFAKSLRGGMPNIIATARDIVDAAHGQLNRDMSLDGMSLTGGKGLPGQAWLSRARDDDRRRDQPEPGRGGDTILNINNPAAERASDAINRSKRSLARLGKAR